MLAAAGPPPIQSNVSKLPDQCDLDGFARRRPAPNDNGLGLLEDHVIAQNVGHTHFRVNQLRHEYKKQRHARGNFLRYASSLGKPHQRRELVFAWEFRGQFRGRLTDFRLALNTTSPEGASSQQPCERMKTPLSLSGRKHVGVAPASFPFDRTSFMTVMKH